MATREFDVDAHINSSPEAVLDYIADINNRPFFLPSLKSVEVLQGDPSAEGTTWNWKWVSLGLEFTGTARCTKKEPGKAYALESDGGIKSTWEYTLAPKEGGTDVHVHVNYEMPERAKVLSPTEEILGRLRRTEVEAATENLKLILDA